MNRIPPRIRGASGNLGISRVAVIAILAAVIVVGAAAFLLLNTLRNPVLGTWICSQMVIDGIANSTVSLTFENEGKVVMSAEAYFLGSKTTISGQGSYNVSGNNVTIVIPIEYGGLKTELRLQGRVEGDRLIVGNIECYRK